MSSRMRRAVVAGALSVVLVLAGCGGDAKPTKSDTPTSPTSSVAPPPTTEAPAPPAPPPPPPTNPLTGVLGAPPAAVVGVKIADTANARPHIATDLADVVYIEQAEAGLTRLLAVYGTQIPTSVGPVRSLRPSDAELLSQYGPVPLASSGGAGAAVEAVDNSILVNAQQGNVPNGYTRAGNRYAPYNLIADLSAVAAMSPVPARDVGFRFAAEDPRLAAAPVANTMHTVVGQTSVDFVFDPASGRYVRHIGGVPQVVAGGGSESAPNVLVQMCDVHPDAGDIDVNGALSMYTVTVGTGPAVLFRSGKRIDGTWSRPAVDAPTMFTAADGTPMLMAPGSTWVVLAQNGAPVESA